MFNFDKYGIIIPLELDEKQFALGLKTLTEQIYLLNSSTPDFNGPGGHMDVFASNGTIENIHDEEFYKHLRDDIYNFNPHLLPGVDDETRYACIVFNSLTKYEVARAYYNYYLQSKLYKNYCKQLDEQKLAEELERQKFYAELDAEGW